MLLPAFSLVASGLCVALMLAAHALKPEISPRWRLLSELAIGRRGFVMDAAFIAWSASNLSLALALRPLAPGWVTVLLMVVSLGPLGAAFADTDPITTPPAEQSCAGRWHGVFGLLFILGFPVVAALFATMAIIGGSPLRPWFVGLGLPVWGSLTLFIVLMTCWRREGRTPGPAMPLGWPNRLFAATYVAWTIGIALAARSLLR